MEVIGKVKLIGEVQTFGNNGFRKRELVLTTQEQYPQSIMVEFIQDRCELLDTFNVGDFVKIDINLRGREWVNKDGETKYFNSIQGWRIEKTQNDSENPLPPIPDDIDINTDSSDSNSDDLPF